MLELYLSLLDSDSDKDKLELLYNAYYNLMISVAMQFIKDKDRAMDIVHDAVLVIIKHLDCIDPDDQIKTKSFLCITVKHRAIDMLRHDKAVPIVDIESDELSLEDGSALPLEQIVSIDGYKRLCDFIDSLDEKYKIPCQLKYINGLKELEIADVLKLPPKTVNIRIFRARQLLKNMILEDEANDKQNG